MLADVVLIGAVIFILVFHPGFFTNLDKQPLTSSWLNLLVRLTCFAADLSLYSVSVNVIHPVFYLLKKKLCSENVLELSYKIVTGFKQHLNKIIKFNPIYLYTLWTAI